MYLCDKVVPKPLKVDRIGVWLSFEDNLGVTALSNLRAYAGAGLVMALFALYSLSRKHLQDIALTMLIISLTGWDIGQIISYVADGKPDSFTTGSIVVQALLIPVAWKALKSK